MTDEEIVSLLGFNPKVEGDFNDDAWARNILDLMAVGVPYHDAIGHHRAHQNITPLLILKELRRRRQEASSNERKADVPDPFFRGMR